MITHTHIIYYYIALRFTLIKSMTMLTTNLTDSKHFKSYQFWFIFTIHRKLESEKMPQHD